MTNKELAKQFQLLAKIMELNGENKFKIRSYQNAYQAIRNASVEIFLASEDELTNLPGIGKTILSKILEIQEKGTFEALDNAKQTVSSGIIELFGISGLGAKKIAILREELGIESPGELLYACSENRLVELKGFGTKTQANIQKQLEYYLEGQGKLLLHQADAIADLVDGCLRANEVKYEWTGDYARDCPVVRSLDVLLLEDEFEKLKAVSDSSIHANQLQLTIDEKQINLGFQITSKERYAVEKVKSIGGNMLNALDIEGLDPKDLESEAKVFDELNLPYLIPSLRDLGEQRQDLIEVDDIKGLIHAHSRWSDGSNTLKEMAQASKSLGHEYMLITDHSKSAFYAGGLTEDQIYSQHAEIDKLNEELDGYTIFKGIESDILRDGSLDYSEDVLKSFDLIIASIHTVLNMTEADATDRLIKAIENPYTSILGHPTGRLLLSRPGYPIDHKKIIDACVANGVVIELNANPARLDIDWEWMPYLLDKGALISINPDAHSIKGISHINYGVRVARKGGLTAEKCLSAFDIQKFKNWISVKQN